MKRPLFWIVLGAISLAAAFVGVRYFPQAFSIVALDITMDRDRALSEARTIIDRDRRGPADSRQAASFGGDEEAQTFVELEGGGKDVFTRMLRDGLYSAYTWRVRHFKEGEINETTIRFTPDGRPYGFVERLKDDAPGAALEAAAARKIAEDEARARWAVDFNAYMPVEQGLERRPGGRVDHTFAYERGAPTLNEGRYRVRLVVSGDRLTEVTHFIKVPEAFSRRYANMRSANEAIGIGAVVGLAILYLAGGIGIGLFIMLRQRWVLWRPAVYWGIAIAALQMLASINELPLLWMTYDTALPRTTFLAQQIATLVAAFIGYAALFGLSFMAAETLTRRAFPKHPQLWRVWSKSAGSSREIFGLTAAGYLLVAVFFAYDVLLYLLMTRTFGWWSPSEALLHPDVLATYVPWLSAIANSFQAGFWEESLFRAVPLAGAALIGDKFGKRKLFLVLGFIVQAIIFGAGHAPYPNQPAFARPVELIIPSIGFGLLYVYFGLLPGIILHFTFDVVWFALPIFLASAPGIRFQQLMVVVMTLVPLWIVLWRRVQAGEWRSLPASERNAAWQPPVEIERAVPEAARPRAALGARTKTAWTAIGAVSLVIVAMAIAMGRSTTGALTITRQQAGDTAARELERRGITLGSRWRVLPLPDDGAGGPHEFVSETAGEDRRQQLIGTYLPAPRWRVRFATFVGDIADRAEEWQVFVTSDGQVRSVRHTLPEGRAGASLDEDAARVLAKTAMRDRLNLDVDRGQAREISARPSKLKARTDWTFTFADTTVPALPQGEPRLNVEIAGDAVAAAGRFIYVPDDWERRGRANATRNTILAIVATLVFGGLLVASGIAGVVAWSRRQYTPRLFVAAAGVMLLVSIAAAANGWPALLASLPTIAPLPLAVTTAIAAGLVGITIVAALNGLALGALPQRIDGAGVMANADAARLGLAAGLFGAAAAAIAAWLRTPDWARAPEVAPLGSFVPLLQLTLNPVTGFLTRTAVLVTTFAVIDRWTSGWTRRRTLAAVALAVMGFLATSGPAGSHIPGWLGAGAVLAAAILILFVTLLRHDLTIVPLAIGTMIAVQALARGAERPFPGAPFGAIGAAVLVLLVAWWWFGALRRGRDADEPRKHENTKALLGSVS